MSADNTLMKTWKQLSKLPKGKYLFSRLIDFKAPYFGTVNAQVEELRPNYTRLSLKKRRAVENHIGTVHVIAICNMLEKAMGVCAETSIPDHLRWIPKGMEVEYPAKADSDLIGIAEIDPEQWRPGDLDVKVEAYNKKGDCVVKGVIRLWISEKKARK